MKQVPFYEPRQLGTAIDSAVSRERDRIGKIGLWALMATLVAIYFAALWGPPWRQVTAG